MERIPLLSWVWPCLPVGGWMRDRMMERSCESWRSRRSTWMISWRSAMWVPQTPDSVLDPVLVQHILVCFVPARRAVCLFVCASLFCVPSVVWSLVLYWWPLLSKPLANWCICIDMNLLIKDYCNIIMELILLIWIIGK